MTDEKQIFSTVDEYVEASLFTVEERLREMRDIVRAAAPGARETIDHNLPSYVQDGVIVVQLAGHSEHTSLHVFPLAGVRSRFAAELEPYRMTRSAIRFPVDDPLPAELVEAIVRFRVEEATEFAARKRAGR